MGKAETSDLPQLESVRLPSAFYFGDRIQKGESVWGAIAGHIVPALLDGQRRIQAETDGIVVTAAVVQHSAGESRTPVILAAEETGCGIIGTAGGVNDGPC
jgi:hypothetical protein